MSILSRTGLMACVWLVSLSFVTVAVAEEKAKETSDKVSKKDKKKDDKKKGDDDEEKDSGKDWSVNASYGLRIGQGTFVDPAGSFEDKRGDGSNAFDRVSNFYSVGGSYSFSEFSVSSGLSWSHQLAQGGGANRPGEIRFQDIGVNLGWNGMELGDSGVRLSAGGGVSFPTSVFSRATSQILATGVNVGVSRRVFDRLSFNVGLNGGKTFHEYNQVVGDLSKAGDGNILFRSGGAEQLGQGIVALGDRNTEYSLGGSVGASVSLIDGMRLSANYGYSTFWTYAGVENDDEFRSPYGDSGRGRGDFVSTGVSLSYSFLDHFSANVSIRSGMPPKTSDQSSFRFPFWNFQGAASNMSALNFGLNASY